MFGWRKRNDGFEWRQYVRTTILVRREKRRQKIDEVREAAINKVKEAGEKGARAGVAGAEKVGQAAKAGLDSAARSAQKASLSFWNWNKATGTISAVLASMRHALGSVWGPISKLKGDGAGLVAGGRPRLRQILLAVAGIAGFWAAARAASLGLDSEVKFAAAIAVAALVAAGLAHGLALPQAAGALAVLNEVQDHVGRLIRSIPIPHGVRNVGPRVLGAGALALGLAIGAGLWAGYGGRTHFAGLVPLSSAPAETVSGRAVAVAGDTLRIAGKFIRLAGIEAPERNQKCALAGTKRWDCGTAAAQAMAARIKSKTVRCDISEPKPAGTARGVCRIDGSDLAADLVKSGHVFAEPGWFGRYAALETEARAAKAGLWRGEADRPSDYRAKRWEEARRAAPEGCPIKGQLSADGRVYVLPWAPQYDRIKIRATKGERWFCSEAEAQAAGWKPIEQS